MKRISFLLVFPVLFLSSLFKISFGLGSFKFFFSGINFIAPAISFCMQSVVGMFFVPILLFFKFSHQITFGLPTLIATLCWLNYGKSNFADFVMRFLFPLVAILIFTLHPIGGQAYFYSFYWFIPVLIYLTQKFNKFNSVFSFALSVSFVSHAVGSIIWLYAIPMTFAQWIALMPVVFFERFIFTAGSVAIYLITTKVAQLDIYKRVKYILFAHP